MRSKLKLKSCATRVHLYSRHTVISAKVNTSLNISCKYVQVVYNIQKQQSSIMI